LAGGLAGDQCVEADEIFMPRSVAARGGRQQTGVDAALRFTVHGGCFASIARLQMTTDRTE